MGESSDLEFLAGGILVGVRWGQLASWRVSEAGHRIRRPFAHRALGGAGRVGSQQLRWRVPACCWERPGKAEGQGGCPGGFEGVFGFLSGEASERLYCSGFKVEAKIYRIEENADYFQKMLPRVKEEGDGGSQRQG